MRQDTHKPSSIIPEDYQFVAFVPVWRNNSDMGIMEQCAVIKENREIIREHMERTGGNYSQHEHGGSCHVCGAWAVYMVVYYHAKTNTYIKTGMDCANKLDMSYGDMNAFRKAVYAYREAKAGIRKAEKFMADNDLLRAMEIIQEHAADRIAQQQFFTDNEANPSMDEEVRRRGMELNRRGQDAMVIEDVFLKLVKYGSISDKQVGLVRIKVQRHDGFEARQRQFDQEREAAQPCPTGRVKVTGTILKLAEYDSQFGTTLKMTVKAAEGFMVFVSVPSALANTVARGQEISFVATLTPSDRDPKFGFGKRPIAA
jgi:hypothetical protein